MRQTPLCRHFSLCRHFDRSGRHDETQYVEAWGLPVSFSICRQDYWRLLKSTASNFERRLERGLDQRHRATARCYQHSGRTNGRLIPVPSPMAATSTSASRSTNDSCRSRGPSSSSTPVVSTTSLPAMNGVGSGSSVGAQAAILPTSLTRPIRSGLSRSPAESSRSCCTATPSRAGVRDGRHGHRSRHGSRRVIGAEQHRPIRRSRPRDRSTGAPRSQYANQEP